MKKLSFLLAAALLSFSSFAQENLFTPKLAVKIAPAGLAAGNLNVYGEYNFGGKSSVVAKVGIPVTAQHTFTYEGKDAEFDMKTFSTLAGYRLYLSQRHMRGFYFEPFVKYVQLTSEGVGSGILNRKSVVMNFTGDYKGAGLGAQLGAQFFIAKRIVVDIFFLGPEINTATAHFHAKETSNTIPWTFVEAEEAEQDIHNFIDGFPFIRDKVTVAVDRNAKTVTADFKDALPGFRAGISLGVAL